MPGGFPDTDSESDPIDGAKGTLQSTVEPELTVEQLTALKPEAIEQQRKVAIAALQADPEDDIGGTPQVKNHLTAGPSAGVGLTRDETQPRPVTFSIEEEHFTTNLCHDKDDATATLTMYTPEHPCSFLSIKFTAKRDMSTAENKKGTPYHMIQIEVPTSGITDFTAE
ncbi:hypothetical protein BP5796_05379 [Coleophoma crateriformis]|uniref:Uncharacterized protein n=1 Tax=Coleophoma crateriformis TaxID=565419 RepID=A0A3D8S3L1_9HELO|nr:hypothetical protein BP5796_05379 [Coleophoma crateriformis]